MTRQHLYLVADNSMDDESDDRTQATARESSKLNYAAIAFKMWSFIRMVCKILWMPFRAIGWIYRTFIDTGIGVVEGIIRFIIGVIGLGLLAVFLYGVSQVIFYPLFH